MLGGDCELRRIIVKSAGGYSDIYKVSVKSNENQWKREDDGEIQFCQVVKHET